MGTNELVKLVKKAKLGENMAFEHIYIETKDYVYFYCLQILKNEDDTLDVVSETFLKAYKSIGTLKNNEQFKTWIISIAKNTCYNHINKRNKFSFLYIDEEDESMSTDIVDETQLFPQEMLETKERRKIFLDILNSKLSDVQRQTVILFYYNGETIENIASLMDCSPGTVKSRLFNSKAILKKEIEKVTDKNDRAFVMVPFMFFNSLFEKCCVDVPMPKSATTSILSTLELSKTTVVTSSFLAGITKISITCFAGLGFIVGGIIFFDNVINNETKNFIPETSSIIDENNSTMNNNSKIDFDDSTNSETDYSSNDNSSINDYSSITDNQPNQSSELANFLICGNLHKNNELDVWINNPEDYVLNDTEFSKVSNFTKLSRIVFNTDEITTLSPLQDISSLKTVIITLNNQNFDTNEFNKLTQIKMLSILSSDSYGNVTNYELKDLKISNLNTLEILGPTELDINSIIGLKNLNNLSLNVCNTGYESIANLSKISQLNSLTNLNIMNYYSNDDSKFLTEIAKIPSLKYLYIGGNEISDISELVNSKIETLEISGRVKNIMTLKGHNTLKNLTLASDNYTEEEIQEINSAFSSINLKWKISSDINGKSF